MTESDLTARLVQRLRKQFPEWVTLKLSDSVTSGIPDIVVTRSDGTTIWLECKRYPRFRVSRLQSRMCARLARSGHCYYVFYIGDQYLVLSGLVTSQHTDLIAELTFNGRLYSLPQFFEWLSTV